MFRNICVHKGFHTSSLRSSHKLKKWPKRIFSGVQPTGSLHLGNYFGAIQTWVNLQNTGNDVVYSIVDLHSISLPQEPKKLNSDIRLMAASLIACGIDPSKSILFQQSKVPQHTLLSWVLGTLTTMTRLMHFPQYKEKSSILKDIPLGLFIYPVLQSADILLYKATDVPIGEDQLQHLHLAQHLVHTFNNKFGETFPFPEVMVESGLKGGRIRSLREPDKKMSKSHSDDRSRINLTDTPDMIISKIKKAVTDHTSAVEYDSENRPGVSNLIAIHSLTTGETHQQICDSYSHLDTGKYKLVVADALIAKFEPIRKELLRINGAPEYLNGILEEGSQKAEEIAQNTWSEVTERIGFSELRKQDRRKRKLAEATK